MTANNRADLIEGLRNAMGDDRKLFCGESLDGKYIDERIAFECYTDEQKAELKKKYAKTDEEIEKQRQKIIKEGEMKKKLETALKIRGLRNRGIVE